MEWGKVKEGITALEEMGGWIEEKDEVTGHDDAERILDAGDEVCVEAEHVEGVQHGNVVQEDAEAVQEKYVQDDGQLSNEGAQLDVRGGVCVGGKHGDVAQGDAIDVQEEYVQDGGLQGDADERAQLGMRGGVGVEVASW